MTGSNGFIGRHLVRNLLWSKSQWRCSQILGVSRASQLYPPDIRNWTDFHSVNCDLTLEGHVASLMLRYEPDVVFHLAGDPLVKNWDTTTSFSNYIATHNLLKYAPEGCRFVLASSATVYGNRPTSGGFRENTETNPTSPYGVAKLASEKLVHAYSLAGRVSGLSLRLAATVGAGAGHGLLFDIIRKLRSDSPTLELLGDGPGSSKPFTHVSDVADGMVHLGLHNMGLAINLALSDQISVLDVAKLVMLQLNIEKPISWAGAGANWKGDNPNVLINNNLAFGFGWVPRYRSSAVAIASAAEDIVAAGS